jgi:hypothetical protein
VPSEQILTLVKVAALFMTNFIESCRKFDNCTCVVAAGRCLTITRRSAGSCPSGVELFDFASLVAGTDAAAFSVDGFCVSASFFSAAAFSEAALSPVAFSTADM